MDTNVSDEGEIMGKNLYITVISTTSGISENDYDLVTPIVHRHDTPDAAIADIKGILTDNVSNFISMETPIDIIVMGSEEVMAVYGIHSSNYAEDTANDVFTSAVECMEKEFASGSADTVLVKVHDLDEFYDTYSVHKL